MIACHSCISSGAKTEAEMKNVICQDYSCAYIYVHIHTYTHTIYIYIYIAHKSIGSKSRNFSFLGMQPLIRGPPPLPRMICMPRGRGAVPIYCLLLIDPLPPPPLRIFTNSPVKIIAFSRARPIFHSVIIVDNSCPPLSTASSISLSLPPPSIKSRPV